MAAKKRATKKVATQVLASTERPLIEGPEYRDNLMYLSDRDLATYELARTRYESTLITMENLGHRVEKERRDANERINALKNDQLAQVKASEKLRAELLLIKDAVQEKYGVDLLNVSYDDKTGKIFENQSAVLKGSE
jgi:hypothetical protein